MSGLPDREKVIKGLGYEMSALDAVIDELERLKNQIAVRALVCKPNDPDELQGWFNAMLKVFQMLSNRLNELSPMTDKPFTED